MDNLTDRGPRAARRCSRPAPFWPDDAWDRTQVLRWMSFEQYSHEPAIAVNRYYLRFTDEPSRFSDQIAENAKKGAHALQVMDGHLGRQEWFVGGRYTIADIALYAYTHLAGEGGFDLDRYPAVVRWLRRVEDQPGYVAMMTETGGAPPEPFDSA